MFCSTLLIAVFLPTFAMAGFSSHEGPRTTERPTTTTTEFPKEQLPPQLRTPVPPTEALRCVSKCEQKFWLGVTMIDLGRAVHWGRVLSQLEHTCTTLQAAFDCAERCNATRHPFRQDFIDVTCDPRRRSAVRKQLKCFVERGDLVDDVCRSACSEAAEELKGASTEVEQFAGKCTLSKCHARCSRAVFAEMCTPMAALAMQLYAENILHTFNAGWGAQLASALQVYPPQCHYFFFGQQYFGLQK